MDDSTAASLERRLRALEDRFAIYQTVCGYGPAVDGLNGDALRALYAPDGVYAVGDMGRKEGREAVAATTTLPGHVATVEQGCGHISTMPYVVIDGDRAVATCHTMLVVNSERGFTVARLSASRLELSRTADGGWQTDFRQNWLLDGNEAGPALLARLNEGPGQG
jgi:hypothetical protein